MATVVTHALLEAIGVTAIRSGNVLVIEGEQIAVGEACNGMRMVFALFLVVYAFVFGCRLTMSTRIVLLALSPIAAIICNVIRLVPTSVLYGQGVVGRTEWFHDVTGWVMLPVALMMLAAFVRLLEWLYLPVMSFRLAAR